MLKPATDIPRIVIAGAASNVGKTTVTAGLIAALRQRGLAVQPFKCGPDYIDPSYHEQAAGRPCRNLDTWMLSDSQLLDSFARACQEIDVAVVEGVMGLYDGSDWHDERGSTAQIAKLLQAPVLLVLDISGSARSAAAAVLGYKQFDPAVSLCGVVLNFAGSERHARGCAEAIAATTGVPMVGWLPRDLQLTIPERHLGLVPGGEQVNSAALIAEMASAVGARFDIDAVMALAGRAGSGAGAAGADAGRNGESGAGADGGHAASHDTGNRPQSQMARAGRPRGWPPPEADADAGSDVDFEVGPHSPRQPRVRRPVIAVARDEAFCFYYPENLELLAEEGARIEFFSPLRNERPGSDVASVYLGGGYPELHGPALSSNVDLWKVLKDLHAANTPIYAECGGFMVLTEALTDAAGGRWPMAGLVPGVAQMSGKLAALGYRQATALRTNLLVEAGESLRGHEFRYSTWSCNATVAGGATAATGVASTAAWFVRGTRAEAPSDSAGYVSGNLLASYLHVHFGQRPELARRWVEKLR